MKAEKIMDALGNVDEAYIIESAPGKNKKKNPHIRWVAAVIAIVMLLTFFQTPPGVAALESVKEAVTGFIETLFEPKDIPIILEGETEDIHHQAGGKEPEMQEDGTVTAPGFAIYYDPESYVMTEENGITYIRFVSDNSLPPCEIEIKHVPNVSPSDVAETTRKEMTESWKKVSELHNLETREGMILTFTNGMNWDDACGYIYFLSDEKDGCFLITARYFVEAEEGHGARFSQMIQTFEVIDP